MHILSAKPENQPSAEVCQAAQPLPALKLLAPARPG